MSCIDTYELRKTNEIYDILYGIEVGGLLISSVGVVGYVIEAHPNLPIVVQWCLARPYKATFSHSNLYDKLDIGGWHYIPVKRLM